jgi:hypothetical protein
MTNSESLGQAMIKATDTTTVIEGYDAIRVFLETVWRRHGRPVDQIALLLGSVKWADGAPVDPTTWQDWLAAVGGIGWVLQDRRRPMIALYGRAKHTVERGEIGSCEVECEGSVNYALPSLAPS